LKSQIFSDQNLYELPFGFVVLPEKEKKYVKEEYAFNYKGKLYYLIFH
jgi:hypothetical protein